MQSRAMGHIELLKLMGFDRTSEASSSSKLLLAAMLLLCMSQSLRVHILHDDLSRQQTAKGRYHQILNLH